MKDLLLKQNEKLKELIAHLRTVALVRETTRPWNRRREHLEHQVALLERQIKSRMPIDIPKHLIRNMENAKHDIRYYTINKS